MDDDGISVDVGTVPDNTEGLIDMVKGLAQLYNNII